MKDSHLRQLALQQVKKHIDEASSALVQENCAKEKGTITHKGNPLFEASSNISDARAWIEALLECE